MSNRLNQDQDQPSVGPELGLNCLQRLSADKKVANSMQRVKHSKAYKWPYLFVYFNRLQK